MQSKASSVAQYLAEQDPARRAVLEAVRAVILENLDADFEEGMQYGMIGYYVPHRVYPSGYHCDPKQPLPFAGLAAQKNYLALYLMSVYGDEAARESFEARWRASGKKLDMGKSCIRFAQLDQVPLDVLGDTLRAISAQSYIAQVESARSGAKASLSAGKGAARSTNAKPKAGTATARTKKAGKAPERAAKATKKAGTATARAAKTTKKASTAAARR